jgi:hypothetical protein
MRKRHTEEQKRVEVELLEEVISQRSFKKVLYIQSSEPETGYPS